jgi:hypothetical protein
LLLSLIGAAVLLLFVLERAANFHHLPIPDSDWLNAALEIGGIVVVGAGTLLEAGT